MAIVNFLGFESGGVEHGALGQNSTIVSTGAISGSYSLKQVAGDFTRIDGLGTGYTHGIRFKVKFAGFPSALSLCVINSGAAYIANIGVNTSGQLTVGTTGNDLVDGNPSSFTFSVGVVYTVRWAYDGNANGVFKVWVDNTLVKDTTHTASHGTTDTVRLNGWNSPYEVLLDDFLLTDTATQPPKGQSILVKPVTGSPSYNAWTKSSGSDAWSLWDDVPIDEATYCVSTGANVKQTAKIPSANVPSGATINACKVFERASRTGGSGRTFQIIRIIGGSETNTTVTLGTSAAWVHDGQWTTTLANLNGSANEIGMFKSGNSGGQESTVYEAFLYIDYTPVEGAQYVETGKVVTVVSTPALKSMQTDFKQLNKLVTVVSIPALTMQTDFKQLSRQMTIIGVVTEIDSQKVSYDETNRLMTIASQILKTEQVDFYDEQKNIIIIATPVKIEQVDFYDEQKQIVVVSIPLITQQSDFKQLGKTFSISSEINHEDAATRTETSKSFSINTAIVETEQLSYKEQNKSMSINAVINKTDRADYQAVLSEIIQCIITETDIKTGAQQYNERYRSVLISSLAAHTDRADFIDPRMLSVLSLINGSDIADFEDYRSITALSQIFGSDRIDFKDPHSMTVQSQINKSESRSNSEMINTTLNSLVSSSDAAGFADPHAFNINAGVSEIDNSYYQDVLKSIIIAALITEYDATRTGYNERNKIVSIIAALSSSENAGFSEILDSITSSFISHADRADFNAVTRLIADAVINAETRSDMSELSLQMVIESIVSFTKPTTIPVPATYILKDSRTKSVIDDKHYSANIQETRTRCS